MVTVRLNGGLGNQMFQYAVGRTIASRRGTPLVLDVSVFKYHKLRQYSLGVFKIVEDFAPGALPNLGRLGAWLRRFRPNRLRERSFTFDPAVLESPDGVYLDGYWQSYKYFNEIESVIRHEFSFRAEPDQQNKELAERILGLNAVSVHVRRTDNVSNPAANKDHGICPVDYYRKGMILIASQTSNPHFFVFSDDPSWVRANLDFDAPVTLVTQNDVEKGYEDLRLMSLCRHHIVANSSFSWWGAWLSNTDGIVVAPKKWFNLSHFDTRDLIPERWVQL